MKSTLKFSVSAIVIALSLAACQQDKKEVKLDTEEQKVSYVVGYRTAEGLREQLQEVANNGAKLDNEIILSAIRDQLDGKESKISDEDGEKALQGFMQKLQQNAEKLSNERLEAGKKFLEENKAKEGVKTTESGLQYKVTKEGNGEAAKTGDEVVLSYKGTLTDGTEFDSSKDQTLPFPVVEGFTVQGFYEALQLVKAGGEYTFYLPSDLAYGPNSPTAKIPSNSVLVFDIKVESIDRGAADKKMEAAKKATQNSTPKK